MSDSEREIESGEEYSPAPTKRGRGRPKSATPKKAAKKPGKRGRPKSAAKSASPAKRKKSPTKKKAAPKPEKKSGKVTISGRRVINNVVQYKVKIGSGEADWQPIYDCPDLDAVLKWEEKQFDAGASEEETDGHFEVDKIVDQKFRYNRIMYLVRWKGFSKNKDSWQKEETFEDCPAVLDDWQKKIQEKAAKKQMRMEKALKRREEKAAQKAEEKKTNPPKKRGRKPKAE